MKWEIKEYRSQNEPHPYMLLIMDDNGGIVEYGHERYANRKHAIARAKFLASQGQRVDVMKDVASSYGCGKW